MAVFLLSSHKVCYAIATKMKFPVGTPVVLKTGGPVMTVTDEIELTCTWAADGRYKTQEFQQEDLKARVC